MTICGKINEKKSNKRQIFHKEILKFVIQKITTCLYLIGYSSSTGSVYSRLVEEATAVKEISLFANELPNTFCSFFCFIQLLNVLYSSVISDVFIDCFPTDYREVQCEVVFRK